MVSYVAFVLISLSFDASEMLRFVILAQSWVSSLILLVSITKTHLCNILKISPQKKTGSFQIKNSGIFHISAQNIDCGYSLEPPRRGGSNEYPQSMFLSRNKKNNVYPL